MVKDDPYETVWHRDMNERVLMHSKVTVRSELVRVGHSR